MTSDFTRQLRESIREVPNFPKPGILFYDITTMLKRGELFQTVIDLFVKRYEGKSLTAIAGIESRGFIFGAPLAARLGISFVPLRKKGKLPSQVESASYNLEYGSDGIEIHSDSLSSSDRVVLIDDLIATGGTAFGSAEVIRRLKAELVECAFLIELVGLHGKRKLEPTPVYSLLQLEG